MWFAYLLIGAALLVLTLLEWRVSNDGSWYQQLKKPKWNPPMWVARWVWRVLFVSVFFALAIAWNQASESQHATLFRATTVTLFLNGLWFIIFFKWRLIGWALLETVLLWVSIVVTMLIVFPYSALSGWLLTPYLAWVTLSWLLGTSIYLKNTNNR